MLILVLAEAVSSVPQKANKAGPYLGGSRSRGIHSGSSSGPLGHALSSEGQLQTPATKRQDGAIHVENLKDFCVPELLSSGFAFLRIHLVFLFYKLLQPPTSPSSGHCSSSFPPQGQCHNLPMDWGFRNDIKLKGKGLS